MKKAFKKGFTLVELLVVIAILAILATVSIVGYTGFINKANRSVDEQFVTQLNTYLEAAEVVDGKPAQIVEAQKVLEENDVAVFKATYALNSLYWAAEDNKVIIFTWDNKDKTTGKVTYPEKLADKYDEYNKPSADWKLLNENIDEKYSEKVLTATTPSELVADLKTAISSIQSNEVIVLPENAELPFEDFKDFNDAIANTSADTPITIDLNGATILKNADSSDSDAKHVNNRIQVLSGQTLELVNGNIELERSEEAVEEGWSAISTDAYSTLILRNINYTTNTYGIYVKGQASEVIIDNCKIKSTQSTAIGTNALGSASIKVKITNSTFEGGVSGALLNVEANISIENCTFIGKYHGLVLRAGYATIKNTTIKTSGAINATYTADGSTGWGGGSDMPSAALVVGDYTKTTNSNYRVFGTSCDMTNVTLVSETATAPKLLLAAYDATKVVNITTNNTTDYKVYGEGLGTITVNGQPA